MLIHPLHRLAGFAGLLALAALGTSACEDRAAPTAPEGPEAQAVAETTLHADGPPAESGPIVVRFEQDDQCFTFPAPDSKSGLFSFQCFIDVGSLCEGDPQFFTQETQIVQPPLDSDVIIRLERTDEMYVALGEESWLGNQGSCQDFLGNLVADGVAKRRETDNDQLGSGTRTNAFGWMLHGILDLAEGGQARYREILRVAGGHNSTYTIDLEPID